MCYTVLRLKVCNVRNKSAVVCRVTTSTAVTRCVATKSVNLGTSSYIVVIAAGILVENCG